MPRPSIARSTIPLHNRSNFRPKSSIITITIKKSFTWAKHQWYRNINLLSIDYDFRPRLRTD